MSNNLQPIMPMEGWNHGTYGVQTRRYVFCSHTACWVLFVLGHLVRVIFIAVVCNKPAAHKMERFASHFHNNFCTLCWISAHDKAGVTAFQDRGKSLGPYVLCHLTVCLLECSIARPTRSIVDLVITIISSAHLLLAKTLSRNMQPATLSSHAFLTLIWLSKLSLTRCIISSSVHPIFCLVHIMHWPKVGLVKTHFYGIWVQQKILRPNYELNIFHKILSDVVT